MDLIRIGAFELYPSERMLCVAGKPVDVGARAFDLLLVLAEHQGRLVTKTVLPVDPPRYALFETARSTPWRTWPVRTVGAKSRRESSLSPTSPMDQNLGAAWRISATDAREHLDEVEACSVALGLRA